MLNQFSRTELLIGKSAIAKLAKSKVAVFGIGGVGSYVVEGLVRSGLGKLDLIDHDKFSITNLNRQLYATQTTIDEYKTDIAAKRIMEINPNCKVNTYRTFFLPENAVQFDFKQYDYIVDAIDTVSAKIALVLAAQQAEVPIISAMGAGNKLDPTMFEVSDIYKTSVCPLAKVMRCELKKQGVKKLKVVYSKEKPIVPQSTEQQIISKKCVPGSVSFVPSVMGLIIAGEVIKDLINQEKSA